MAIGGFCLYSHFKLRAIQSKVGFPTWLEDVAKLSHIYAIVNNIALCTTVTDFLELQRCCVPQGYLLYFGCCYSGLLIGFHSVKQFSSYESMAPANYY